MIWADSSRGKSGLGCGYTYLNVARPIVKRTLLAYVIACAKLLRPLACYPANTRQPSRPNHRHLTRPWVLRNNHPCTYRPLFNDSKGFINTSEHKDEHAKVTLCADSALLLI